MGDSQKSNALDKSAWQPSEAAETPRLSIWSRDNILPDAPVVPAGYQRVTVTLRYPDRTETRVELWPRVFPHRFIV